MALGLGCELAGWLTLAGGSNLLLAVHLLALGLLVFPLLGMGWQLLPVLATRPPSRLERDASIAITVLAILGAAGLVGGMAGPFSATAPFALALPVALMGRSAVAVLTVAKAPGRLGIRAWIAAAELTLLGGAVLGGALYLQRAGVPLGFSPPSTIAVHAALMALGWGGGNITGFAALLFPMFAIAREPADRLLVPAGALWFVGILGWMPPIFGLGALAAALLLGASLRGRGPLGPGLVLAGVAQLGLLATAAAWTLERPFPEVVALAAALWILPLRVGVALRIVPFLAWANWLSDHPKRSPAPAALVPTRLAWVLVGAVLTGGALVVTGTTLPAFLPVGALVLATATLLLVATLGTILSRAFFANLRAGGLAGTESP
ncbi:hypothetical protein LBMAG42_27050 [Deltaproteobacteria bacterium]|nr:hypothetical protein LBMAG42_27050 [Deltaproteobacteria bacterium]